MQGPDSESVQTKGCCGYFRSRKVKSADAARDDPRRRLNSPVVVRLRLGLPCSQRLDSLYQKAPTSAPLTAPFLDPLRCERQGDEEAAALTGGGLRFDGSPMQVHHAADDGET